MDLQTQYAYVQSSRRVLLDYCATITPEDFVAENTHFGRGSIRNLGVHIGTTYEFWIGQHALQRDMIFTESGSLRKVADLEKQFFHVDQLVAEFIQRYADHCLTDIEIKLQDKITLVTPLKLFSHVITHEFHHKGQILSLSRHLGYVPIDTDIMR
jgi:uncharacterized damage-inducible protein DinB